MTTKKRQGALRAAGSEAVARVTRRFARACRLLASECVEGIAPPLAAFDFGGPGGMHCAMGEALSRCVRSGDPWEAYGLIQSELGAGHAARAWSTGLLIDANNGATPMGRHAAVVFPLLCVADQADEAAASVCPTSIKAGQKKPSEQQP